MHPCSKLIGARYYDLSSVRGPSPSNGGSPRDDVGHGTHTSSTAAGSAVTGASYYGLASGTAKGGSAGSRVAMYRVCAEYGCAGSAILAGFDDAIADGVDVISISIGSPFAFDYVSDVIAIGAFHAMKRGVLTSASAGNSGLEGFTVCNVAPWMLSVAASSIDRKFIDKIVLGNGKTIVVSAEINMLMGAPIPVIIMLLPFFFLH